MSVKLGLLVLNKAVPTPPHSREVYPWNLLGLIKVAACDVLMSGPEVMSNIGGSRNRAPFHYSQFLVVR